MTFLPSTGRITPGETPEEVSSCRSSPCEVVRLLRVFNDWTASHLTSRCGQPSTLLMRINFMFTFNFKVPGDSACSR